MGMIDNEYMKTKNRLNKCYGIMVEEILKNELKSRGKFVRVHGSIDLLIDTDYTGKPERKTEDPEIW